MSRLPTYDASPSFSPQSIQPATGGAQSLIELSNNLQKMGTASFVKSQTQKAIPGGELAGEYSAQTGTPLNLPTATTEAQAAYNKAALQTNRQMLLTDMAIKIPSLKQQSLENNQDANVAYDHFNQLAVAYGNKVLQGVPDQNKAYVQNMLNLHIGQANLSLRQQALSQLKTKQAAQFSVSDSALAYDSTRFINSMNFNLPDEDVQKQIALGGKVVQQRIEGANLALQGGIIKSSEYQKIYKNAIKDYNGQIVTKQFENILKNHPDKATDFLKNLTSTNIEGYNETDKLSLINQLNRLQRDFKLSTSQNTNYFNYLKKNYLYGLQNGGNRNVRMESVISNGLPKDAESFNDQVNDSSIIASSYKNIEAAPLNEQQELVNKLIPDKNDPDYGRKYAIYEKVNSQLQQSNTELKNDKVKYFLKNPNVIRALNNKELQDGANINFNDNQAIFSPLAADPNTQLLIAQKEKGFTPEEYSLLTNNQAKSYLQQLRNGDGSTKINVIDNLKNQYKENTPIVMRDLLKNGMSGQYAFIANVDPKNPDRTIVADALNNTEKTLYNLLDDDQKINFKSKQVGVEGGLFSKSDLYYQYKQSLSSMMSSNTVKHLSDLENIIKRTALSYIIKDGDDTDTAFDKAEKLYIPYNFTTINNSPVRIPPQYNENLIQDYAKVYQKKLDKFDFSIHNIFDMLSKGGTEKTVKQFHREYLLKKGHWITREDNEGLVWVLPNGQRAVDSKGNSFGFSFKDAINFANQEDLKEDENKKFVRQEAIGQLITGGF